MDSKYLTMLHVISLSSLFIFDPYKSHLVHKWPESVLHFLYTENHAIVPQSEPYLTLGDNQVTTRFCVASSHSLQSEYE